MFWLISVWPDWSDQNERLLWTTSFWLDLIFGGKTVWMKQMNWSRHSERKRKHMDIVLQLVLTHIKALTWLIFAIYQSIVKFYAESEYDVYFFQKLLENVQIEHFMIPPLFDKNLSGFSTCVILLNLVLVFL